MTTLFRAGVCAALFLTLAAGKGCEGAIPPGVMLPRAPSHYLACFKQLTPIPVESLTPARVAQLAADLRRSELAKSACGQDLLDWYGRVRAAYAPSRESR